MLRPVPLDSAALASRPDIHLPPHLSPVLLSVHACTCLSTFLGYFRPALPCLRVPCSPFLHRKVCKCQPRRYIFGFLAPSSSAWVDQCSTFAYIIRSCTIPPDCTSSFPVLCHYLPGLRIWSSTLWLLNVSPSLMSRCLHPRLLVSPSLLSVLCSGVIGLARTPYAITRTA